MEKNELIQEEHDVLDFWEREQCFQKRKEQAAGRPLFRFLDGPITANNPMGIHHAWGRSLKDIYIRYKFQQGYDCRCQNGFDAQGLWVEVGVEKELGFESKRDIEAYGLDKFTQDCKARVGKYAGIITEQSKRLGMWMDWGNDYFTHTDDNIEGIWHFLKKCHGSGWLRQEHKPMPWCPRCGTSLSEHEMTGSYKRMTHESVFVQLPVAGKEFNILVWTTTPWTLSSNVALAVNPEIEYALVQVKSQEKLLVLAKNAIKQLGEDKLDVLDIFKGEALVGLTYDTCFPDFAAQKEVAHRIVAWEDVDADEGTGVVHIAPGCGAEDFSLGLQEDLPQVMPVDDLGIFTEGFGFLTGKSSQAIAGEVFGELKRQGKLYKTMPYEHSYPVCWRCKTEVIFRLVPAWYITVTDELRSRLIASAKRVKWEPESGGRRMEDWLQNMGDWNISRKRYYGLPLPFYPCSCGELTVVGSKEELKALIADSSTLPSELHRPWIDAAEIKCPKCGKKVKRIPDTGDVWLDAGIVPYSTTGYFKDKSEWEKNFPAEWITEMHEQIRLWFYSMLFMSVVLEDRPPYERVMCSGMVTQEDGSKFSKTGFMIQFDDAAEQIGSDSIRYLYAGSPNTSDVRFGFNLGDEARRKLLGFRNIFSFFDTYYGIDRPDLKNYEPDVKAFCMLDKWLLVRANAFIQTAGQLMDSYKVHVLVKEFEGFVDDVSNWYIRLNRRRFWKSGDEEDKRAAYFSLYSALKSAMQIMAPIIPFQTEAMWQKLVRIIEPDAAVSIHLSVWPKPLPGIQDDGLLEQTERVREIIATALRLRNESQMKVRQPLKTMYAVCDEETKQALLLFQKQVQDELNVKELVFLESADDLQDTFPVLNFKEAGRILRGRVNEFKEYLQIIDTAAIVAQIKQAGEVHVDGWDTYPADMFTLQTKTKPGIVSTTCFNDAVTVALDIELTEELKREGALRDLIRHIQTMRKDTGYAVEQRIRLSIQTQGAFLRAALDEASAHVQNEVLADTLTSEAIENPDMTRELEIAGEKITLQMKK